MRKLTAAMTLTTVTAFGCSAEREPAPQPVPTTIETTVPSITELPTSTTVERGLDIQPLLDAEALLSPIEPQQLASFVDFIKQNGEVLDWSNGSRYRVVAFDDGIVFTAELDFGFTPPTTPNELATAKPEFINVYARFPGEERAEHVFMDGGFDGSIGSKALRPDGRVNEMYGFDPPFDIKDVDSLDRQGLLDTSVAQMLQSGPVAQELYAAAVNAVLGQ